ncbi:MULTISPECIES: CsgG/HfaB family protein [unclassified Leeuwenhoekiella]|uniref:CsgG/HfaB family protein n=1 Tax=unclassified Leeuwenhoekiella TaxID=2615029 RepID=UPI000490579C|nr:CsgG/HfaB family protein [Leeuwenhoekiella sp. MAR_2009_132]
MRHFIRFAILLAVFSLHSCGAFFNQPLDQTPSHSGEFSKSTRSLLDLPAAQDPVEVAVYNFRDQTGQYKAVENGSTFSTAVTQGGTTILLKALEDSGWFIPIERENLSNLSTERNIIRNTKQEYIKNLNPNEPPLPPLKYAGVILEGGIVSYDTNIITGGIGARYFGLGGSAKYRQDRITVYLRMVSTSNGEILKTVYVSKTILSQALDANFFRFVKFQRLLEAEMGITQNEPVQIAVQDAIEKAVRALIIEGVESGYWSAKGGKAVNEELVLNYNEEKELEQSARLYERTFYEPKFNDALDVTFAATLFDGDYTEKRIGPMAKLGYSHYFNKIIGFNLNAGVFQFKSGSTYEDVYGSIDLNAQFRLLPNDKLSPYLFAGGGIILGFSDSKQALNSKKTSGKIQYGAGIEYSIMPKLGIKIFAENNITFTDEIEGVVNGKRDDFYWNFGLGLNYYFNLKSKKQN